MEIIHVSAECYPVAKAGGLGDVVGALPKYLQEAGHQTKEVQTWATIFLIILSSKKKTMCWDLIYTWLIFMAYSTGKKFMVMMTMPSGLLLFR